MAVSAAPCAVPPQSSVSLENPFAGIWSTQGKEELAGSHSRIDQNGICSEKLFQATSENTALLGERPDTFLARSQTYTRVHWVSQLQSKSTEIVSIILSDQIIKSSFIQISMFFLKYVLFKLDV